MSIRMLKPMSLQLCPDARQTAGMEVSIVALICIHGTLPSPLQFRDASSQQRWQMRRVFDQIIDVPAESGGKRGQK